jgi:hypothetical protein
VLALLRVLQPDLTRLRFPRARDKARLLRAIDRSRSVLGLSRVLRIVGLSHSRLAAWQRAARVCALADASSCPRSSPQRLTAHEVSTVRAMVTAPEYRHVRTGRLAVLAQRLGRVVASPSTWHRLVRERGWRRPRLRIHPAAPREGRRQAASRGFHNLPRPSNMLLLPYAGDDNGQDLGARTVAVFKRQCGGFAVKIHDVDHDPPHCHVDIKGRNTRVCLMTLRILNPPPHSLPPTLRKALTDCREEMLRAWDDVKVRP